MHHYCIHLIIVHYRSLHIKQFFKNNIIFQIEIQYACMCICITVLHIITILYTISTVYYYYCIIGPYWSLCSERCFGTHTESKFYNIYKLDINMSIIFVFIIQIATDCNENIRRAENELRLFAISKRFPSDDVVRS